MTKMFILAGDSAREGRQRGRGGNGNRNRPGQSLNQPHRSAHPENTYHIYTVADFQKLAPDFDFTVYFKDVEDRPLRHSQRSHAQLLQSLNELIANEPVDAWKCYFRWHMLHASGHNLPKAFFDENFAFFGKTLSGQKEPTPRWKQCAAMTDGALGEAVGQDWVKKNFPPEAKASMDQLVAALEKSLGDDIKTLPWMSDDTKKAAEEKLAMIRNKIGYPEKWRDIKNSTSSATTSSATCTAARSSSATTTSTSWASRSTRRSGA